MPVLGWHILAGNHQVVDFLIAHGVDLNQEFDGVDSEGNMFGIFTVRLLIPIYFRIQNKCFVCFLQNLHLFRLPQFLYSYFRRLTWLTSSSIISMMKNLVTFLLSTKLHGMFLLSMEPRHLLVAWNFNDVRKKTSE